VITIGYFTKDDKDDRSKRKGIVYAILIRIDDDGYNTDRSPIIFDGAWNTESWYGFPHTIKSNSALGTTSLDGFVIFSEHGTFEGNKITNLSDCYLGYVQDGETPHESKETREQAIVQAQKRPKISTEKHTSFDTDLSRTGPPDFTVDNVDSANSQVEHTVRPYCKFRSGFLFLDDRKADADPAFDLYGLRELHDKNFRAFALALEQKYKSSVPEAVDHVVSANSGASTGWSTPSHHLAAPNRCWPISAAIPIASLSPTAGSSRSPTGRCASPGKTTDRAASPR
jgi:hypothetical protein